jgi:hypothetical protein
MTGKELIQAWVPLDVKEKIKELVKKEDELNISSWVRRAIKEKIERDLPSRPQ